MTNQPLHVIFGTGPVGCWTARALRDMGLPVRAVNRSGKRPDLMPADVEIVSADASDPQQAIAAAAGAAAGAAVIYQALNPPYHRWHALFPALQAGALAAAKTTGARYVSIENLYMYDSSRPMHEDSPIRPRARKGELRARMAQDVQDAHRRGDIQATALRSSDCYGPGVTGSAMGALVFGNLMQGKKAQLGGSAEMPHSWAYIADVGRAAALLGTRDEALGQVWFAPHASAVTQGEMVRRAAQAAHVEPRYTVMGRLMLRLGGLFIPEARASVEMLYEFTEPFVVESGKLAQAFGIRPTPVDDGIAATVAWYRAHTSAHK